MKNIINIICVATVWAAVAANANALTLKSGEVLTSDGTVAKASETANGQRQLEQNGHLVASGVIYISIGDDVIEVPVNDIRGKSKAEIIEVIGAAAVEQMADQYDAVEAHLDEIGGGINAIGKTTEEIANEISNSDAIEGAVAGLTEAQAEALNDYLQSDSHLETDPVTGEQYQADVAPGTHAGQ